ncbi:MAG: enoyl-CoA hydratase/isomerase family protein [Phycisphaerales bacterium]|nr:MAG: enoyl-CoA hydratase/isomerase family protein [Phycisphaerales bacterium]
MSQDNPTTRVEDQGAVRKIILNRPDVLNAFNADLLESLGRAVRDADKDEAVRCVLITGAGRAFCSGQDVADLVNGLERGEPVDLEKVLHERYNPIVTRIREMKKPVIAAVNGAAAGAGWSLALACDLRIAAESAVFLQAFINIGAVPDAGSTYMLPRLVGMARAAELCFTGRKVSAAEALQLGLVNRVVPNEQLADEAMQLARELAARPTRTIGWCKRALDEAWTEDFDDQLEREAKLQGKAIRTEDYAEGIRAFIEKRPAQFKGR